jgi:transcriptional regulator with XRE-family HTH domain
VQTKSKQNQTKSDKIISLQTNCKYGKGLDMENEGRGRKPGGMGMTKQFSKEVGQRIRNLRKSKGYTAKDLSRFLDMAESTVIGWEIGHRSPDLYNLARLADILCVTTDYLLGRESVEAQYYKELGKKEALKRVMTFIDEEIRKGDE